MAERLTEKDKNGNNAIFQNKDKFTIAKDKNNDIRVYGKAIDKLAQLEDIMAKYGIESVEELDKKIGYYIDKIDLEAENDYLKKAIEKQNIVTQSISKDRDTWQKACELACDVILRFTDGCPCKVDYFYQQAKEELGNE